MRESRADTLQAGALAILLHVLLFALVWLGMWWTRASAPLAAAGPVIEAELIDPDALSAQMQQILSERPEPLAASEPQPPPEPTEQDTAPPQQPLPEPVPEESPVPPQPQAQERVPEPDTREQEQVSAQAQAQEEAREREQEEQRRQEQIDLTERKRQEEAERKQRLSEMERQRQQQLADIRRQRAEAARQAEEAARKLERIRAAEAQQAPAPSASPPPGNAGDNSALLARYSAALQAAIERNWTRPENIPVGQRCRIVIRQIPGGEVISAEVDPSCPYDERGRRSIEAAVLKAQPLPYAGFEDVFRRTLLLNFQASDR